MKALKKANFMGDLWEKYENQWKLYGKMVV
jgi:hypothetical protein